MKCLGLIDDKKNVVQQVKQNSKTYSEKIILFL